MHRSSWRPGAEWWQGAAIAAIGFAVFLAWLAAFERYLEPWARRSGSGLLGCTILWMPAGPLRVWGSKKPATRAREGVIAVAGLALVLLGAAVPVLVLQLATVVIGTAHDTLRASAYLMSVPLMGSFVVRVMWRRPD
jgi:hypothetical protein